MMMLDFDNYVESYTQKLIFMSMISFDPKQKS